MSSVIQYELLSTLIWNNAVREFIIINFIVLISLIFTKLQNIDGTLIPMADTTKMKWNSKKD